MTATIRFVTRRASGRESTRTTEVAKNQLAIGRATDCDINLPDLRIGLRHARLTISAGTFIIEAEGDNEFRAGGRMVRRIEGRMGAPLDTQFGPYRLRFTEEAGRLVVTVERTQAPSAASDVDPDRVFSLRGTWLRKRSAAWIFALVIGALFLAFPIATFASKAASLPSPLRTQAGQMWISGQLAGPHEMLAKDCSACHEKAFISVRDETCLSCHRDIHDHADRARMIEARGEMTAAQQGLRAIAAAFDKPAGRCAECHAEHNGHQGIAPTAQTSCTSCHAGLHGRLPDAHVADASDFGRDHPQFRPTVVAIADLAAPKLTREWTVADFDRARALREKMGGAQRRAASCDGFAIGQPNFRGLPHTGALPAGATAGDNSGLVFPHDVHLAATGCVAAIAQRLGAGAGYGGKLECKNCHTPAPDGGGFLPVNMERDCKACHSLVFDRAGGFDRELRHGRTSDVIASLLDFYQARIVGGALGGGGEDRRRPGEAALRTAGYREAAFANAGGRAATRVRAVFAEGGACYGCHVVLPPSTPNGLDFKVAPVSLRQSFLPKAMFRHRAHETGDLKCESCHTARTSQSSADVLMPPVATCQKCHGGEHATADVQSSCTMCHGFHATDPNAAPMRPTGVHPPRPVRTLFR